MRLNTIKPGEGSRREPKRPGRGIGSGIGKTGGRGHKGQKSRAGGFHKVGFEGGQMPLQRRLPKRGFRSRKSQYVGEVRLDQLAKLDASVIDMTVLQAAHLITKNIKRVKVIASGELSGPITVRGLACTRGARAAIEAAGGRIEDAPAKASASESAESTE